MGGISETARLLASLELQDKFTGPAATAGKSLDGLEQKTGLVQKGFGLISQAASGVGGAISHLGGRIGQLVTGPLGLLGLGGGLFGIGKLFTDSISQARDFGKEVGRLSALTGLGTETTSRLAAAFEHFGIETDQALTIVGFAEKTLGKLTSTGASAEKQSNDLASAQRDLALAEQKLAEVRAKRGATQSQLLAAENRVLDAQDALNLIVEEGGVIAGGAAGFYQKYGLALTDASGKIKDFNTLLLDSADFFNNKSIPAETKAAALATIYGKSWQTLIPILSAGRQGIADAEEEAAKLGLTLTKDNLVALGKLKEATRRWGDTLGGLKLQLGLAVIPLLTDLTEGASRFLSTADQFGITGSQKIVGFFKDVIEFGKKAFGVIEDQVVPLVKRVIQGWNDLPAPLKSLLVKGTAGNFAIKFLLGFDPIGIAASAGAAVAGKLAGAAAGALGGFVLDFFGKTAAQKLIPQAVSILPGVVPIPVFVTNPGFGLAGGAPVLAGEVAAGAAGVGAGAIIAQFLGVTSASVLGFVIGSAIGKAVFFNPTVEPAVSFERRQFEELLKSNDPARIQRGLDAINAGLFNLKSIPLAPLFVGDQIKILEDQRDLLQRLLDKPNPVLGPTRDQLIPGSKLVDPAIERLIKESPNLVTKQDLVGIEATIPNTAFGAFDTIAADVKPLPHILDKEELSAQRLQNLNMLLATLPFGISSLVAKDFSPKVTVNVSSTANISVSNVARTLTSFRIAGQTTVGGYTESAI